MLIVNSINRVPVRLTEERWKHNYHYGSDKDSGKTNSH
jgi:hypothetical protein